ncbi:hypothetical protein KQX54_021488 [Cotesia glomerata]|uniref:Uncharacterized protein n=1 Tax=Cotesia glomerata TaxID=32391 RepID=A0AAV7JAH5_COTGL|nr:hypothetical protein KQX54_021488 [Cotesia glomerata]
MDHLCETGHDCASTAGTLITITKGNLVLAVQTQPSDSTLLVEAGCTSPGMLVRCSKTRSDGEPSKDSDLRQRPRPRWRIKEITTLHQEFHIAHRHHDMFLAFILF